MTETQRQMVVSLRDYCNRSLAGDHNEHGDGVIAAIINTVDTAMESKPTLFKTGLQKDREVHIMDFILTHMG